MKSKVKNSKLIKRELLGLPIYDVRMVELINYLNLKILSNEKVIVYGYAIREYGRLKKMPKLVTFLNNMDVVIADGAGLPLIAKHFGVQVREHLGTVNVCFEMLNLANKYKYKVLLFGATQETNDKANINIKLKYPNLILCEGINGYFKEEDELDIVKKINKVKPDIILIGITSPIKEIFSLKYKNDLNTKIIIPCGGMIDVLAGKVKRPPFIINKVLPLTWFFRFIQEPRRLFKPIIVSILNFVFLIYPILIIKHILGIERNPSIVKHLNIKV